MASTTSSTSIRMSGLVSGLDTDSIVKNLMKAESAPLNKLLQKKQTEEWQRDQYREMNALLLDLRSATSNMKLQGTFQKKVMASNDESVATAKQKGFPSASTYNVNVTKLPKAAEAASVKFTTKLADGSEKMGKDFTITLSSVDPNASSDPDDSEDGDTTSTVGQPVAIKISAEDTIADVIARINAVSAQTGIKANYLEDDKSITLTNNAAAGNSAIYVGTSDPDTASKLGIIKGNTVDGWDEDSNVFSKAGKAAEPGSVKINGITYNVASSTFTFDGIEFNLKKEGLAKINVKQDEDAIFNAIKTYVDKYNDVIDKLNSKISETKYRDYQPLLDEEKQAMTDKQVEQWEDKAKSGLLRQDPILSGLLSQMRTALSSDVAGTGDDKHNNLSEIGITTGSYYENGKLYIDETKLRQAISENGTAVMDLFTKTSTSTDSATKYSESGLAQRLYDQINNAMTKITDKAGSAAALTDNSVLGKDLTSIAKQISDWQARLQDIEDRYWKKFTAMETAMSKANSQSSWLTQQLG
ncbi:flagellar filament capping protein FliD [Paenibacillus doosanensis]|uniref:flagellar filament capping protein FliD n=1 Tax=Paenibacillus doosanensis TaxID=1229154 RepID=UPI0021804D06|nr:flagellar filament capping protein FliD [Paenibacillus doosanensis]MCS7459946.1 flagellar filament capping protein FliD [Paenibacillus doosanensis]